MMKWKMSRSRRKRKEKMKLKKMMVWMEEMKGRFLNHISSGSSFLSTSNFVTLFLI